MPCLFAEPFLSPVASLSPDVFCHFVSLSLNGEGVATAQSGHSSMERKQPDEGEGTTGNWTSWDMKKKTTKL